MLPQEELEQLSNDLSSSLATLYEFKILFENNQEHLALLNNTAPYFFLKLYDFYWNDLIMSISRLTDPSQQRIFKNLSVFSLEDFVFDLPAAKQKDLRSNLDCISKEVGLIRRFRNKYISHRDKDVIKIPLESRETLYIQKVEKVFSLIEDSINIFHVFYENTPEVDHKSFVIVYGAQSLIYYLQLGKKFEDLQDKMLIQEDI